MRCISFFLLLTLSLTCTCHAYQFALISKTIPKGSYYVVTSLTSNYLSPFAGTQRTQLFNSSISTTTTTDAYVDTVGMGYFAIVSMEKDAWGSYCVIRVLDAESSTLQQNGLSCTIAPSLAGARVQVEPSLITCGGVAGTTPCKSSIVAVLDIDSQTDTESTTTTTEQTNGASLGAIIGAASAGVIGIFIIAGLLMYRAARNRMAAKRNITTVVYNNNPSVTVSPISTPLGGAHVRTQTEQLMSTYMVNPVLDADQPDMRQPAPYQSGNIYKPRLNLANAAR